MKSKLRFKFEQTSLEKFKQIKKMSVCIKIIEFDLYRHSRVRFSSNSMRFYVFYFVFE